MAATAERSDYRPPLTIEELYAQADPLDLDDGRRAAHHQAQIQRRALLELEERVEAAAEAEHAYRVALAKKMLQLRESGVQITVLSDVARGEEEIATLKQARDIADGMVVAQRERVRELEGERAMLRELLEYSRRATTGATAA
jgi:hypothetical protein